MEVWAVEESLGSGSPKEILSVILWSNFPVVFQFVFLFYFHFCFVFQFEYECRARGADILAYPPVVAGGNRSNTLHYVKNNQLIKVHKTSFKDALSVGPDALVEN